MLHSNALMHTIFCLRRSHRSTHTCMASLKQFAAAGICQWSFKVKHALTDVQLDTQVHDVKASHSQHSSTCHTEHKLHEYRFIHRLVMPILLLDWAGLGGS